MNKEILDAKTEWKPWIEIFNERLEEQADPLLAEESKLRADLKEDELKKNLNRIEREAKKNELSEISIKLDRLLNDGPDMSDIERKWPDTPPADILWEQLHGEYTEKDQKRDEEEMAKKAKKYNEARQRVLKYRPKDQKDTTPQRKKVERGKAIDTSKHEKKETEGKIIDIPTGTIITLRGDSITLAKSLKVKILKDTQKGYQFETLEDFEAIELEPCPEGTRGSVLKEDLKN